MRDPADFLKELTPMKQADWSENEISGFGLSDVCFIDSILTLLMLEIDAPFYFTRGRSTSKNELSVICSKIYCRIRGARCTITILRHFYSRGNLDWLH